ncbi:spermidine synthase [Lishizhenia tianjinensis]|uniref:S-adenosylmethionine decarboxylase proenzyme n=1 Tax=Lishizhenia tianjinensis TaxID=477690 RepID=A0A1I7AEU5_9FLAO|nr:polyamine aminopropyltransferase [Lishizhenia tianjinensis]SFT73472.1 spermidine synthase [Lishizhenia tianjinensis]
MSALGNHILVEFMGCSPEIMNDVSAIERDMVGAAQKAGATVINSTFHHFNPYGVSGVVVIQESHLAIHTWPEYGYAAVDLFTCGEMDAWISFDFLKDCFQAKNYSALEMKRGSVNLLTRNDFDISTMRQKADEWVNPGMYTRNVWFTDKDENQALSLKYTGEVFHDVQSPFQRVRILESPKYGKLLTLDDMFMTTENDEFHYHEMISHPAMMAHGNVKNVLVIGGGDGGTVREILKHEGVEKVTMVEIDGEVIEACKKHLPSIAAAFDDPRLELIVGDGIEYVKQAAAGAYDLLVVDGSDPVGPAEGLFSVEFYQNCYNALNENGILIAQGESPKFNENAFAELNATLRGLFGEDKAPVSLFYVPTYPTGMWSFQYGIKGNINMKSFADQAAADAFVDAKGLRYYNTELHTASFALPNFVKDLLK